MTETALVIPCYNEARRLNVNAFRGFIESSPGTELIFVDDGSTDETLSVLEQVVDGRSHPAHIVRLERNQGKAEAVRQGILYALDRLNPAVVGFWDADLATPLDAIARLRSILDTRLEREMIFGARVQLLGRDVQRKAVRHYLGRTFATAVSLVLEVPIYDTQCGAKLFRVYPHTRSIFASPFLSKWVFDVEILARYRQFYRQHGKRLEETVYEHPLERWVDVSGSKVRPVDFLIAMRDVYRIRRRYFGQRLGRPAL